LVGDWIRYQLEKRQGSDARFAAWEQVDAIVHDDPEQGWALTLALVEAAPDDEVLANVAAGPLEDLLSRSFDILIGRVEARAQRDPRFCRCLTAVWGLPPALQAQLAKYTSTVEDPL